jgi:phage terminase Nu1 subunit (DNA packaging protein)
MARPIRKIEESWGSIPEVGRVTGVPSRTIENWKANGIIPVNQFNEVGVFAVFKQDLSRKEEEIDRLKGNSPTKDLGERLTLAQCRKIEAEADLKELELEKAKALLIEIKEVESTLSHVLTTVKSRIAALPARVASQVSGMTEPRAIAALLTKVLDEALNELSALFENGEVDSDE